MKKILLALLTAVLVQGCFPPPTTSNKKANKYEYELKLLNSTSKDNNIFEDDLIESGFVFDNASLAFMIRNKAESPIKIKWDEASLVVFGKASKVIHAGVRFMDAANPQSPTVIPPKASVQELAAPTDNVRYQQGQYGGWRQDPILPMYDLGKKESEDMILSLKGSKISFYMPVLVKEQQKDYNFDFEIVKVTRK